MNNNSMEFSSQQITGGFDETNFIRLMFRAKRSQKLQQAYSKRLLQLFPVPEEYTTFPSSYFLTPYNFATILERYYPGSWKHHNVTKFTIPLLEVYQYIHSAYEQHATPITGVIRYSRELHADKIIGISRSGSPTNIMTVISDHEGRILSAYPGLFTPKTEEK